MATPREAKEGDLCPKCGTKMRCVLCAPCYGTGKARGRACKLCGGSGVAVSCLNFRAHTLWPRIRKSTVPPSSEAAKAAWWNWGYGISGKYTNPFRRGK
jgi:hypothetical protein